MKAIDYYENNKAHYLTELIELTKIPSISFAGFDPKNVEASANYVNDMFARHGIINTQVVKYKEDVHPYVIASVGNDPKKLTYLLYAHHDVQPVGDETKWETQPFEPIEKNGRLCGRGAADDKAGVMVHLGAIDAYLKTQTELPINLIILIDGEEEIGSENLGSFLKDRKDLFPNVDGMILTDTFNFDSGVPGLTTALRGIVVADIEVRALKQSVHSGAWGGPTPDPVMALSKLLAGLVDDEGRILIPGIYDNIQPPSEKAKQMLKSLPLTEETYRNQCGMLPGTKLLKPFDHFIETLWYQPALCINAIQASSRKMAGNIICGSAWAKVGIRIVPNMKPLDTFDLLRTHLEKNVPWGCEIIVKPDGLGEAWRTDPDHPAFEIAMGALKDGYGKDAILMGCGATIPFVGPMSDAFGGIPALLVGIEDPFTNAHSENESLLISDMEKSIKSEIYLLDRLGKLSK
jgi:cysteinylglycine-S-conjugate dipeptidase